MTKKTETEKGTTTKGETKETEKAKGQEPQEVVSAKDAKKVDVSKKK
jgi:hypothetical protein